MNHNVAPHIGTLIASTVPSWAILTFVICWIGLLVLFCCLAKPYIKELKETWPKTNSRINWIICILVFLGELCHLIMFTAIGVRGTAGNVVLDFLIVKYFVSKNIVNSGSIDGYISKTIFIYIVINIIFYVFGVIIGSVLW